jgi:hypothetical protein
MSMLRSIENCRQICSGGRLLLALSHSHDLPLRHCVNHGRIVNMNILLLVSMAVSMTMITRCRHFGDKSCGGSDEADASRSHLDWRVQ